MLRVFRDLVESAPTTRGREGSITFYMGFQRVQAPFGASPASPAFLHSAFAGAGHASSCLPRKMAAVCISFISVSPDTLRFSSDMTAIAPMMSPSVKIGMDDEV